MKFARSRRTRRFSLHFAATASLACVLVAMPLRAKVASASGSAFAISQDSSGTMLITSLHVIKSYPVIQAVRAADGEELAAELVAKDEDSDLALLRVPGRSSVLCLRSDSTERVGEQIYVVGYPLPKLLGLTPKFASGWLSGFAPGKLTDKLLQLAVTLYPGHSGSPVLDHTGRVVGVVAAIVDLGGRQSLVSNVSAAVRLKKLSDFISKEGISTSSCRQPGWTDPSPEDVYSATRSSLYLITASPK